jgi:hypothetical protein
MNSLLALNDVNQWCPAAPPATRDPQSILIAMGAWPAQPRSRREHPPHALAGRGEAPPRISPT